MLYCSLSKQSNFPSKKESFEPTSNIANVVNNLLFILKSDCVNSVTQILLAGMRNTILTKFLHPKGYTPCSFWVIQLLKVYHAFG